MYAHFVSRSSHVLYSRLSLQDHCLEDSLERYCLSEANDRVFFFFFLLSCIIKIMSHFKLNVGHICL